MIPRHTNCDTEKFREDQVNTVILDKACCEIRELNKIIRGKMVKGQLLSASLLSWQEM